MEGEPLFSQQLSAFDAKSSKGHGAVAAEDVQANRVQRIGLAIVGAVDRQRSLRARGCRVVRQASGGVSPIKDVVIAVIGPHLRVGGRHPAGGNAQAIKLRAAGRLHKSQGVRRAIGNLGHSRENVGAEGRAPTAVYRAR
jgi:hypothetical protein